MSNYSVSGDWKSRIIVVGVQMAWDVLLNHLSSEELSLLGVLREDGCRSSSSTGLPWFKTMVSLEN